MVTALESAVAVPSATRNMPDAEQSLRKLVDDIAAKLNYDIHYVTLKPLSTGGANYTTVLFLGTLTAPGRADIEIFAKVANIGQFLRDKIPIDRLFKIERFFYTELLEEYKRIEDVLKIPAKDKFVAPLFYGYNDKVFEETIVLENLLPKGYTVYDRFKSITWEYAAESIKQLANLHAFSFAYAKENSEEFGKLVKELKYNLIGDEIDENIQASWDAMKNTAINVVHEKNRERLRNYAIKNINRNRMKQYQRPLRHPVIIHGDFRASNLMHKTDDDGKLQVIIIDYQTMQAGCPVVDLLYYIFNCSDEGFRSKYFDKLVEHYYSQLCLALQRLHMDPEKVYPREDFDYELKEMLPYGLSIGIFTLQIVTVEAANAPKLDGELSKFSIKTSDLFSERLNGIVNDYIRWGIL